MDLNGIIVLNTLATNISYHRCSKGYGARWTIDGTKFRGFLEPQMEEGHSVGWRH